MARNACNVLTIVFCVLSFPFCSVSLSLASSVHLSIYLSVCQAADLDNDGVISQDDFRYMLDMHRVKDIPASK